MWRGRSVFDIENNCPYKVVSHRRISLSLGVFSFACLTHHDDISVELAPVVLGIGPILERLGRAGNWHRYLKILDASLQVLEFPVFIPYYAIHIPQYFDIEMTNSIPTNLSLYNGICL